VDKGEDGRNEVAKLQDLQRLNPGLGHHKKMTTRRSARVGLGDNNHKRKQLKIETGALQGGAHQASHHLLLPALHHTHRGTLGTHGEPNLGLVSGEIGVDA
jgi:hypothetical protein